MKPRRGFGLTAYVAMVLVAVVLLMVGGAVVFHLHDRSHMMRDHMAVAVADRIVTLTELLEDSPPEERRRLVAVMNSRVMRVWYSDAPTLVPEEPVSGESENFRELLVAALGDFGGRSYRIGFSPRGPRAEGRLLASGGPRFEAILVAVALTDGNWMNYRMPIRFHRPPWEFRLFLVGAIAVVLVLVIALWAAYRIARPLAQFAAAADRLGVDVRAPALPVRGSRELRTATRAFNRMQERLRRMIDDRTLMVAAISHDLRTVLTRLKLRAEFIDDEQQQAKAIADIEEMRVMLDSVLAFAREETVEEQRAKVDLGSMLQSLCDDMADAGQNVHYEGPDHLAYRCQPIAIRRALVNLLDNAVKYGKEATVSVRSDPETIIVAIADRGPGIPEAMREEVFTPFFRLETSRSRETGGTGLGLTVARSVIRRHGGDITFADRPGGGLIVQLRLLRDTPGS